jgi:hypothetical protein
MVVDDGKKREKGGIRIGIASTAEIRHCSRSLHIVVSRKRGSRAVGVSTGDGIADYQATFSLVFTIVFRR